MLLSLLGRHAAHRAFAKRVCGLKAENPLVFLSVFHWLTVPSQPPDTEMLSEFICILERILRLRPIAPILPVPFFVFDSLVISVLIGGVRSYMYGSMSIEERAAICHPCCRTASNCTY